MRSVVAMQGPGATHMTRANSSCRMSTLPSHVRPRRPFYLAWDVAPGVRLVVNSGINMARSAVAIATNTSIRASVSEVLRVGAAASTSDGRHQETLREWRRFLQFAREVAANT